MKRTISLLLAMILLCLPMHTTVFAVGKEKPAITLNSVSAEAGDKVKVNVSLKNNPGIISACINISFDSGLTLIDAKNGSAFPSSIQFTKPKQLSNGGQITGNCNFVWSGVDIADRDIKDGVILTLTFSVSEKAKAGNVFNITATSRKSDVIDKNLTAIELKPATGKVTVVGEASELEEPKTTNNPFKFFIDWLRRFIQRIKELLTKAS